MWGLGKTPIKLPALEKYLSDYPKTQTAKKLFLGFSQGFQLYYTGPRIHIQSKNLISAYEHHNELREKIMKEVELGRVGGAISGSTNFKPPHISYRSGAKGGQIWLEIYNTPLIS